MNILPFFMFFICVYICQPRVELGALHLWGFVMIRFFNRFMLFQKELDEIGRDAYGRGIADGMKLASVGGMSAIHRLKKLDTWDNDLKNEIISLLEIIYGVNR